MFLKLSKNSCHKPCNLVYLCGWKITNFEMESSAVAGLSRLMGHKAVTVCLVIANRLVQSADIDYNAKMKELIGTVLDRI